MAYKKSQRTRQQILDCAKRLFARKGFQVTQIADICDELHIARGTIYQYFDGKEDIFIKIIEEYLEDIAEALDDNPVTDKLTENGPPTLEQLRDLLVENSHGFLLHMFKDRDIGRIIFLEGFTRMPAISDMLRAFFNTRKERAVDSLKLGMTMGLIRPVDPYLLASAMLGSHTRVVLDFIIEGKVTHESELRALAEELTSFQLQGILSPEAAKQNQSPAPSS